MSVLEDFGDYLEAQAVATQGTDLFIGEMPDSPDACTALYLYSGAPAVQAMGLTAGKSVVDFPRLHVEGRATTLAAAEARVQAVYDKLHNLGPVTLNAREYKHVVALQRPFQLGVDQNERQIFAVNFEVCRDGG